MTDPFKPDAQFWHNVGETTMNLEADQTAEGISQNNYVIISKVIKPPRPCTLRTKCLNSQYADRLFSHGIFIHMVSVPAKQRKQNQFLGIAQCYKCLKLDHQTRPCKAKEQTCSH